jgi:uncharacterized membrane protein YphA (DoxX/SURF4 family)
MREEQRITVGFGVVRAGVAVAVSLAAIQGTSASGLQGALVAGLVLLAGACLVANRFTRALSLLGGGVMLWMLADNVRSGAAWDVMPVRNALFLIAFCALAVIGPGPWSASRPCGCPRINTQ